MTRLCARDQRLCDEASASYDDLRAVFVNCTLKRSPELSHTQALAENSVAILEANGVEVELHTARWLTDAGGFPVHGNQRSLWQAGCRFDAPNPERR